jgi:hypothetical protein
VIDAPCSTFGMTASAGSAARAVGAADAAAALAEGAAAEAAAEGAAADAAELGAADGVDDEQAPTTSAMSAVRARLRCFLMLEVAPFDRSLFGSS